MRKKDRPPKVTLDMGDNSPEKFRENVETEKYWERKRKCKAFRENLLFKYIPWLIAIISFVIMLFREFRR